MQSGSFSEKGVLLDKTLQSRIDCHMLGFRLPQNMIIEIAVGAASD